MSDYAKCLVCGAVFSTVFNKNRIYCSIYCKREAAKEKKRLKQFADNYQKEVYEPITRALEERSAGE